MALLLDIFKELGHDIVFYQAARGHGTLDLFSHLEAGAVAERRHGCLDDFAGRYGGQVQGVGNVRSMQIQASLATTKANDQNSRFWAVLVLFEIRATDDFFLEVVIGMQ